MSAGVTAAERSNAAAAEGTSTEERARLDRELTCARESAAPLMMARVLLAWLCACIVQRTLELDGDCLHQRQQRGLLLAASGDEHSAACLLHWLRCCCALGGFDGSCEFVHAGDVCACWVCSGGLLESNREKSLTQTSHKVDQKQHRHYSKHNYIRAHTSIKFGQLVITISLCWRHCENLRRFICLLLRAQVSRPSGAACALMVDLGSALVPPRSLMSSLRLELRAVTRGDLVSPPPLNLAAMPPKRSSTTSSRGGGGHIVGESRSYGDAAYDKSQEEFEAKLNREQEALSSPEGLDPGTGQKAVPKEPQERPASPPKPAGKKTKKDEKNK